MEKLLLKNKLYATRDNLTKIIIEGKKTPDELQVYKLWLEHTQSLIDVCIDRNKF